MADLTNEERILSHNTRLETISDALDVLPTYEDIDAEVTEQEDIIAQIQAVLPFKGAVNEYAGDNPLIIGEDGATIEANTYLTNALQILNGVEGKTAEIGFVTPTTSTATSITVSHSLGVTPSLVGIAIYDLSNTHSSYTHLMVDSKCIYYGTVANATVTKTSNSITFTPGKSFRANYMYVWFAMA